MNFESRFKEELEFKLDKKEEKHQKNMSNFVREIKMSTATKMHEYKTTAKNLTSENKYMTSQVKEQEI